jgi:hypothetical protein
MSDEPDGYYPYMFGPEWQEMKKAERERFAWMKDNPKHAGDMHSVEYLQLRVRELMTQQVFMSAKFDEIADQHVKTVLARRQWVGKAYGRASQKIHDLRNQLQNRAQFQREAMRNCTCSAWRRTHHELFELTEGKP